MQKYALILATFVLPVWLPQALAQVPTLDIEKTCRAAEPLMGPSNEGENTGGTSAAAAASAAASAAAQKNTDYKTCMQSETAARDSAGKLWTKVKASDRDNCLGLSRMVYPSYVELLSCLQMYAPASTNPSGQTPEPAAVPAGPTGQSDQNAQQSPQTSDQSGQNSAAPAPRRVRARRAVTPQ